MSQDPRTAAATRGHDGRVIVLDSGDSETWTDVADNEPEEQEDNAEEEPNEDEGAEEEEGPGPSPPKSPSAALGAKASRSLTRTSQPGGEAAEKLPSIWMEIWSNLRPGIVVALLNVPLSLALANASRTYPLVGIRTSIWGGLVAALLGGSQFNIVGPTGGLTSLLARYSVSLADPNDESTRGDVLPFMAMMVGGILIIVYWLKLEKFVTFMPNCVFRGFMLGVALLITGNQLNSFFGYSGTEVPHYPEFRDNVIESFRHIKNADWLAVLTTCIFVAFMFGMNRVQKPYLKRIPWAVVATGLGLTLGYVSREIFGIQYHTMQDRFEKLDPVIWKVPTWPTRLNNSDNVVDMLVGSCSVAFVACLETMVAGKMADTLVPTYVMNPNQETIGLALANIISGVAGGMPATAALARTSTNIRQGASSRASAIINCLTLLILYPTCIHLFNNLPMAVLCAFPLMVALSMVSVAEYKRFYKQDKFDFFLCMAVAGLCVTQDPTAALLVGLTISLLRFSNHASFAFSEVVVASTSEHHAPPTARRGKANNMGRLQSEDEPSGLILLLIRMAGWCGRRCRGEGDRRNSGDGPTDGTGSMPAMPHSQFEDLELGNELQKDELDEVVTEYRIIGKLTYFNGFQHSLRFRRFDSRCKMVLSLKYCVYIDIDGLLTMWNALKEFETRAPSKVLIVGVNDQVSGILNKVDWYNDRKKSGLILSTFEEAVKKHLGKDVNVGVKSTTRDGGQYHDNLARGMLPRAPQPSTTQAAQARGGRGRVGRRGRAATTPSEDDDVESSNVDDTDDEKRTGASGGEGGGLVLTTFDNFGRAQRRARSSRRLPGVRSTRRESKKQGVPR